MSSSGKIFMNLVMLSIFGVMVAVASQYPPQARFMPLVVGIPGVALCLIQLIMEFRAIRRTRRGGDEDDRSEIEKAQAEVSRITGRKMDFTEADSAEVVMTEAPEKTQIRREIVMWGYVLGLIGGILFFGFWITIPLFMFVFFRFFAETSWLRAILIAALGTAAYYLAFVAGLGAILHEGFVIEAIKEHYGLY